MQRLVKRENCNEAVAPNEPKYLRANTFSSLLRIFSGRACYYKYFPLHRSSFVRIYIIFRNFWKPACGSSWSRVPFLRGSLRERKKSVKEFEKSRLSKRPILQNSTLYESFRCYPKYRSIRIKYSNIVRILKYCDLRRINFRFWIISSDSFREND